MMLSYPRLSRAHTVLEAAEIREKARTAGVAAVSTLSRVHHERQRPVATGRIATSGEIAEARARVMAALEPWYIQNRIEDKASFDRELGAALHSALHVLPSDAAHEDTWNYLTAVVFPDVLALRFPDVPNERVVGGQRNVLRKAWIRHEILGDDLMRFDLKEDELVGLFERTALVRNRRLARLVAQAVSEQSRPKRDKWARKFYKLLVFQTGVRLLDSLDDPALAELVKSCAEGADFLSLQDAELGEGDD